VWHSYLAFARGAGLGPHFLSLEFRDSSDSTVEAGRKPRLGMTCFPVRRVAGKPAYKWTPGKNDRAIQSIKTVSNHVPNSGA
jgi:hypothetical protein